MIHDGDEEMSILVVEVGFTEREEEVRGRLVSHEGRSERVSDGLRTWTDMTVVDKTWT